MPKTQAQRARGRPKTVHRDAVAERAMEVYWREGMHRLSLNEMCRHAGISKPALYREFGGEDGLTQAALETYRERFILPLLSLFDDAQPLPAVLERVVLATTADRPVPDGCLFTAMRVSRWRLGPSTQVRLTQIEQERRAAFETRFEAATDELADGLTPAFAARYLDHQLTLVLLQMATGSPAEAIADEARLALSALLNAGSKMTTEEERGG